jgi:hypothetical protein
MYCFMTKGDRMKKIIVLIAGSLVATSGLMHASVPNFSFMNKNNYQVQITIKQDASTIYTGLVKPAGTSTPKHTQDVTIDLNKQTTLTISPDFDNFYEGETYSFDKGKTIYVSCELRNGKPYLYPQTGWLGGLAGLTTHGYSLSNNVKQNNIHVVRQ